MRVVLTGLLVLPLLLAGGGAPAPAGERGRQAVELVVEADGLLALGGVEAPARVAALLNRAEGRVFGLDGRPVRLDWPEGRPASPAGGASHGVAFRGAPMGPGRSRHLLSTGANQLFFDMVPAETAILYVRTDEPAQFSLSIHDGDDVVACQRDGAVAVPLVCVWVPRHPKQEITITSRGRAPREVQILTN